MAMPLYSHPDRPDSKNGDGSEFKKITDAYEILKNDDIRNEYHEFVDHPERFYQHYATFMRRRMFGHQVCRIELHRAAANHMLSVRLALLCRRVSGRFCLWCS